MAIINYMNLSTARSSLRAKEVGIRKTIGANKWSLVKQIMCESILMAFLAGFLALMIGQLFIGPFNLLVGKTIEIQFFSTAFILPFFGLKLFIGILSGIYPSLMLSSFRIINVLIGWSILSIESRFVTSKTKIRASTNSMLSLIPPAGNTAKNYL